MGAKYEEGQEKASLSIFTLTEVHSWVNVVWVHKKEEPLQRSTKPTFRRLLNTPSTFLKPVTL